MVSLVGPAAVAWLSPPRERHSTALAGAPAAIVAGPAGGAIALTSGRPAASGPVHSSLESVRRPDAGAAGGMAGVTELFLEHTGAVTLASDGERYAAAAYQHRDGGSGAAAPERARCPLVVVDLMAGRSVTAAAPCWPHERVRALALDPAGDEGDGTEGATAYVGLEDARHGTNGGAGRLVVLALPSGAVLGAVALLGTPVDVKLAAGRDGGRGVLYVLEQWGGAGGLVPLPEGGRLLVLDPVTLEVLNESALTAPASRMALGPDGGSVFLTAGDTVRRIDAASGAIRWAAQLPKLLVAIEVMGDRVYVANPEARAVWVLDGLTGLRQADVPVSGHPVGLVRSR